MIEFKKLIETNFKNITNNWFANPVATNFLFRCQLTHKGPIECNVTDNLNGTANIWRDLSGSTDPMDIDVDISSIIVRKFFTPFVTDIFFHSILGVFSILFLNVILKLNFTVLPSQSYISDKNSTKPLKIMSLWMFSVT